MADFDFVIPLAKADLQSSKDSRQYKVKVVTPIRNLQSEVHKWRIAVSTNGVKAVIEHFDTGYSVLHHFASAGAEVRLETWKLILKVGEKLCSKLPELLQNPTKSSSETRVFLNIVKMSCYLLCQLVELFEADDVKPRNIMETARSKVKASKKNNAGWDWEHERNDAVQLLLQLSQLKLIQLWNPPVPEEDFVNLVTGVCYKLLENPDVNRNKATRDAVFFLLGEMVKRYNHGLSASLKIVQLLQHFEHLGIHLPQCMEIFVNEFGLKSVVFDVIREIGRLDARELLRDNSSARAHATFMVEIAEKIPSAVLPCVSVIVDYLHEDSYVMRNAVLGVMGELVINMLSDEQTDQKLKSTRNQFLDHLEEHIHDVNAFVRSKVLQIWFSISNKKAIPLPRQQKLIELVTGRLQDKSSMVRKAAIQFLTAYLKHNPYAAQLPTSELKEKLEKEVEKLKEITSAEQQKETSEFDVETKWTELEHNVKNVLEELLPTLVGSQPLEAVGEETDISIGNDETASSVASRIGKYFQDGRLTEAVKLMHSALENFPKASEFFVEDSRDSFEEESFVEESQDNDKKSKTSKFLRLAKNIFFAFMTSAVVLEVMENEQENVDSEVVKRRILVQYLKDCVSFASQMQTALPLVCQLLGSKNKTDVLEAIEFFVTASEFGVSNSMIGVRQMLMLIWSTEPGVKETLVAAYKRLYLQSSGENERVRTMAIVKNLIALTVDANLAEVTSLEELISEFVKTEEIGTDIIQMLWETFAMKHPGTTDSERRAALKLIAMAASAEVDIVRSNVKILIEQGLHNCNDFQLAQSVCTALLKMARSKHKTADVQETSYRFNEKNDMFTRLADILVSGAVKVDDMHYVPFAEEAVAVIYKLAEHPDIICSDVIKRLTKTVLERNNAIDNNKSNSEDKPQQQCKISSVYLTRLITVVGHVALKQLVHLDVCILNELKRRRHIETEEKRRRHSGKLKLASKTKKHDVETTEDEMGLTGAIVDDVEADFMRKLCDHEVVTGENLLSQFVPLIIHICSNPGRYNDAKLQAAASLTLAKFMIVSTNFCEANLQLLFTILEKSPYPIIRANTIIALGDLSFRFPNLLEPWTAHLYARLHDESAHVRRNTIMVLTHLILNDMVKVKGQISEMAHCLLDSDERISALVKLFFQELSKKGNAVYNIMPDVISRLSDPDCGVSGDEFRSIMQHLFSLIQKDKHSESLVEKLCHRMRTTRSERQWHDLTYCLSLLTYSDRGVKRLVENFSCFADKLADEQVFTNLSAIVEGARKFAKPEMKNALDELENRLRAGHEKGLAGEKVDEQIQNKVLNVRTKSNVRITQKIQKSHKKTKKISSDEEDSDEEAIKWATAPQTRRRRAVRPPPISFSSSDEEESHERVADKRGHKTINRVDGSSSEENFDANLNSSASEKRSKFIPRSQQHRKKRQNYNQAHYDFC